MSLHPTNKQITKACAFMFWSAVAMAAQLNSAEAQIPSAQTSLTTQEKLLPFTIATDTTFITEPLTKKGLVDYDKAANQRNSIGVTAENNSSVLMLQAMGPRIWPKEMPEVARSEYLRWLGIDAVPILENCFVEFKDFVTEQQGQHPAIDSKNEVADHRMAMEHPWTRD